MCDHWNCFAVLSPASQERGFSFLETPVLKMGICRAGIDDLGLICLWNASISIANWPQSIDTCLDSCFRYGGPAHKLNWLRQRPSAGLRLQFVRSTDLCIGSSSLDGNSAPKEIQPSWMAFGQASGLSFSAPLPISFDASLQIPSGWASRPSLRLWSFAPLARDSFAHSVLRSSEPRSLIRPYSMLRIEAKQSFAILTGHLCLVAPHIPDLSLQANSKSSIFVALREGRAAPLFALSLLVSFLVYLILRYTRLSSSRGELERGGTPLSRRFAPFASQKRLRRGNKRSF